MNNHYIVEWMRHEIMSGSNLVSMTIIYIIHSKTVYFQRMRWVFIPHLHFEIFESIQILSNGIRINSILTNTGHFFIHFFQNGQTNPWNERWSKLINHAAIKMVTKSKQRMIHYPPSRSERLLEFVQFVSKEKKKKKYSRNWVEMLFSFSCFFSEPGGGGWSAAVIN